MAGVQENLQQQMEQQTAAISKLSEQVKRLELALTKLDNKCSHCNEKPARQSGYVNWDESHDSIKNMKWVYGSSINGYLKVMKVEDLSSLMTIDEKTRFPKVGVYADLSDPKLRYIIKQSYAGSLNRQMNLVEKYMHITMVEKYMHTRRSFEETYKLKWVNLKKGTT